MAVDTEPFPEMVDINMVTMSCSEETFINMYQALSLQGKRINSLTTEMEQVKLNQKAADKEKGTYIQGQNIQINQGKMPMAEDCQTSVVHNDALVKLPIHTHKPTTCEDALIRPYKGVITHQLTKRPWSGPHL